MAREHVEAPDTAHAEPATEPVVQRGPGGPGVQALQALLAQGRPAPEKVVKVIDTYRGEREAILALLQRTLGNGFVQQVVQAMHGVRADLGRREVAVGDPSDPTADSLVASQDGARWRAANGDFTGEVTRQGLESTYRIDENDAIHAEADFKKKQATIGWEHDGQTRAELYGDMSERDRRELGARTEWQLADGGTVQGGVRHVEHRNPTQEVPYLAGTAYGAPSGAREQELRRLRQGGERGARDEVYASYTRGSTTIDGGIGISGGELAGGANVRTQLGPDDQLQAGIRHDETGDTLTARHAHTFGSGGTLTTNGWVHHDDGRLTGQLASSYRDKDTQLDGSLTRADDFTSLQVSGRQQLDARNEVHGSLAHTRFDNGTQQTSLHAGASHAGPRVVSGVDLDAGTGERDYLGVRGSVAAQVAPNLYAQGFGGATYEAGRQTTAHAGAALSFTPSQKTALTLAGVLDQDGVLETRLQLDVFKDRVTSVAGLTQGQRDALFSVFVSYTQGDPQRRILDDRFGRPEMGVNTDGQVMAGIRIKF